MLKISKPRLLIIKEKYGDTYYHITSTREFVDVLHDLADERLAMNYYEDTDGSKQTDLFDNTSSQKEVIVDILSMKPSPEFDNSLFHFMQERMRNGYEYEGWESETYNKIPNYD